jgi:hypothetical protein
MVSPVFSQSIRGGSEAFKAYVTQEDGYTPSGDEYKRKSRIVRRTIEVDMRKEKLTRRKF